MGLDPAPSSLLPVRPVAVGVPVAANNVSILESASLSDRVGSSGRSAVAEVAYDCFYSAPSTVGAFGQNGFVADGQVGSFHPK